MGWGIGFELSGPFSLKSRFFFSSTFFSLGMEVLIRVTVFAHVLTMDTLWALVRMNDLRCMKVICHHVDCPLERAGVTVGSRSVGYMKWKKMRPLRIPQLDARAGTPHFPMHGVYSPNASKCNLFIFHFPGP